MPSRTFAIGDIHGEPEHLARLLGKLPPLTAGDTLLFLGDYIDRGPHSKQVVEFIRGCSKNTPAKVVCLRGNHEDGWLRVISSRWDAFVCPPRNGCLTALRSYTDRPPPAPGEWPGEEEMPALSSGSFFPADVVAWMQTLPFWYEDEHAIYVHAGLPPGTSGFLHPSAVENPAILIWGRTAEFVRAYRGKTVVFGHTPTDLLPQELSHYTPDDPTDLWMGENAYGLDTGCGNGGFLTALELPAMRVYESRDPVPATALAK